MKRPGRRVRSTAEATWTGWTYLVLLLVCFLFGALIGFALAYFGESGEALRSYLQDYLNSAAQGTLNLSFFSVFWDCVRWPFLVVVFAFTALGVIAIPAFLLVRGFLLAYAVTCFAVLLGRPGLAAAAVLLASAIFLVLPVLLVLGCEGLRSSCARLPGGTNNLERRFRAEIILPGIGVSLVAAALQWTVIPLIFSAICTRYFI